MGLGNASSCQGHFHEGGPQRLIEVPNPYLKAQDEVRQKRSAHLLGE